MSFLNNLNLNENTYKKKFKWGGKEEGQDQDRTKTHRIRPEFGLKMPKWCRVTINQSIYQSKNIDLALLRGGGCYVGILDISMVYRGYVLILQSILDQRLGRNTYTLSNETLDHFFFEIFEKTG